MKYLWTVVVLIACAYARTTQKQQSITPHITSLTDKDARQKASVHPAFANAGRQAGVEMWRINKFEPDSVPQKDFGKFYKGDCYIVLKTTKDKRNNLSWDIHYWIGSESSQDEAGAAAILTVGLDDKFGGAAVQHRETLGYESSQFLGYFPTALTYLDGGHGTGFHHVTTNAGAEKRLLQIKGKRNVRTRQVDPVISSMNQGDCFILDVDHDIYVYVGPKSKNVEKLKAISVANQVRDQDHNGRGKVEIIDQYSSEVDTQKYFTALGSGNKDIVPEDSAGGDDQAFERSEEQTVVLSEVSDSTGKVKVTALTKPYKQEQLKPQECYILDTVSGSIYVWVGKQATEKEKSEAMSNAQQYLTSKNYPSWVRVSRIPQGTEPAIFKQYFTTWRDVGMSHSRIVRSVFDETASEGRSELTTEERRGELEPFEPRLFKVTFKSDDDFALEEVSEYKQHDLQSDSVYALDAGDSKYVWIGTDTPYQLRTAVLSYTRMMISMPDLRPGYQSELREDKAVTPAVVVFKQGFEPDPFTRLFDKWNSNLMQKHRSNDDDDKERMLKLNEIDVK